MAAINFPDSPADGATFSHTYNGLTQFWMYKSAIPGWISQGFGITQGEQGPEGNQGTQGPTGPEGDPGTNGTDGATGATGVVGEITAGGVGMFNAPKLAIVAGDPSVTITGITSDAGITISITAGAGGGGANPEGPEGSVQFADGSSLSGVAEARIVTVNNLNNSRGFSGNFVYYTESTTGNSTVISDNTTISVPFGTRNIYVVDNIALGANKTLTFGGFTGSRTGASMTLVLGYTGESTSTIVFPGNQGIYWAEGPFGVTTGSDAKIYPRTSPKKFDILYFFADGTRIYGNAQKDFKTSR